MSNLIKFNSLGEFSVGTEIELQLINPFDGKPKNSARELLRLVKQSSYARRIIPEITQNMIEVNSSVHQNCAGLFSELLEIKRYLLKESKKLNVVISGGGTHPFQMWKDCYVFPAPRFRNLLHEYGYLAKRFTTFGQHVHIGCRTGDDAIYLTQALHRYVPHFIALSAASPFYQGVDTGFNSTRINVVNALPTSGFMPFLRNWAAFCDYFQELDKLHIIKSIKDIYWDIRPKAELGTVEVRVFDTPLIVENMIMLAAYTQALSAYLLKERPFSIIPYDRMLYTYNRYQASHHGFAGYFIDPYQTTKKIRVAEDMLATLPLIKPYTEQFESLSWYQQIKFALEHKINDARMLREFYRQEPSFINLMTFQVSLFQGIQRINGCR